MLCKTFEVEVTPSELENKALLHAKAGAILAKIEYHITDEEILHAIGKNSEDSNSTIEAIRNKVKNKIV